MGKIFKQTSNAPTPADAAGCALAGVAANTLASSSAEGGNPPAGIAKVVALNANAVNDRAIIIEGAPNAAFWPSGSWVIDINYSARWSKAILQRIDVYRITSSGVCTSVGASSNGMVASLSGIGVEVAKNPGIDNRVVLDTTAGAGSSGAASDRFRIVAFFDSQDGGVATGEVTFDQSINSPLTNTFTLAATLDANIKIPPEPEILETELPNGFIDVANTTGSLGILNNGVDTPDNFKTSPTDNGNSYKFQLDFPTPSRALTNNDQVIRFRGLSSFGDKSVNLSLFENTTFIKSLGTIFLPATASNLSVIFNKSDLTDQTGAAVRVELFPGADFTSWGVIDEVEWVASLVPPSGATIITSLDSAVALQNVSLALTASGAALAAGQIQSVTVGSVLKSAGIARSSTVEAAIHALGLSLSSSLHSAIKKIGANVTLTSDATVVMHALRTITVGGAIHALGLSSSLTVSLAIKKIGLTVSTPVSAAAQKINETIAVSSGSAILKMGSAQTTQDSAIKKIGAVLSIVLSAVLKKIGVTQTLAVDVAALRRSVLTTSSGAAVKALSLAVSATAEAAAQRVASVQSLLDSPIKKTANVQTADMNSAIKKTGALRQLSAASAIKKIASTVIAIMDASIISMSGAKIKTLLLNSAIRVLNISKNATANAALKLAGRIRSTTADVAVKKTGNTAGVSAGGVIKKIAAAVITTLDLAIKKIQSIETVLIGAALSKGRSAVLNAGAANLKIQRVVATPGGAVKRIALPATSLMDAFLSDGSIVFAPSLARLLALSLEARISIVGSESRSMAVNPQTRIFNAN